MPFKYINPGYNKLFGIQDNATQYSDASTYNPINAVYIGGTLNWSCPFPSECDEIWAKTGIHFHESSSSAGEFGIGVSSSRSHAYERLDSEPLYGFRIFNSGLYAYVGTSRSQLIANPILRRTYHNILLHSRNGENGLLELFLDGTLLHSYEGNVSWGAHKIAFRNNYGNTNFSNTIISDTPITVSEEVYVLPPSTTETTMTESNGTYSTTEANQTLKQEYDVDALISKVGSSNLKITGAGVIAKDALFDGEGLTRIVSLRNNVELDEIALANVANHVGSSWNEDLTLAGLAALKVGWKTKA